MRPCTVGLVVTLALAVLVAPLLANAQPRGGVPRMGVLSSASSTVETFVEPPVIQSSGAVLHATLTMAPTSATIAGQSVTGDWTYNGLYVGPTLIANPGDLLDIALENRLPQQTNPHTHGLSVSPLGNSDNILLQIDAGDDNHYRIQIPPDHPQGLYWYHPHFAGLVNEQIFRGLSGMLVIGRPGGGFVEPAGYRQRLFGVKNVLLDGSNNVDFEGSLTDSINQIFTVNGVRNPTIVMRPGVIEVWNIANLSNNGFFSAILTGAGNTMTLVARDGNPQPYPLRIPGWANPPGKRGSLVIQAGEPGTYELRSAGLFDGTYNWLPFTITTLVVEGDPAPPDSPPTTLTVPKGRFSFIDLRDRPVAENRTVVLSQGLDEDGVFRHFINGEAFPNPTVFQPRLNTVEEWTFINTTDEHHPMHMHVNAMQSISIDGNEIPENDTLFIAVPGLFGQGEQRIPIGPVGYDDTVHVPPAQNGVPGVTVVRTFFREFLGTVGLHCHRVDHEDNGMMSLVTIIPERPIYAAGSGSEVKVYDGQTNQLLWGVDAFPDSPGGVSVALGDVNFDGIDDVALGAGLGAEPQVRVFDEALQLVSSFMAYDPSFQGGVTVGTGLIIGRAFPSVVTGAGVGGTPEVAVFAMNFSDATEPTSQELEWITVARFLAYEASFRGGVNVSSVRTLHGDDLLTGRGLGGPPQVKRFKAVSLEDIASFLAFDKNRRDGVTVGG